MSYLVLARKWRPQTFSDLTGQEHVTQTLRNAIESGRIAHAFLFTGARGVGKTSSARILAKALTCERGMSPEPCNECQSCREITAGTAVDVLEIDGASNTGVDDIRELRENVRYLPSRLRYKIFIIDEVHMLSTSAFNALLKTLEEPPPHVKFIFATTEPHKVPITILSRCQRFDFRRIPLGKVIGRLRHIVDQEGIVISDSALTMVARKGDGSMRDSLSVLDQLLAFCGDHVRDEDVVSLLGVVDRRLLTEVSGAVFARDTRSALGAVARVDEFGYNMRQFCGELIDHLRNLLVLKAVGDSPDLLDLSEGELEELRRQAEVVTLEDLQRHLSILLRADGELAATSFPRLVLEMALVRMANLPPAVPVDELLERLRRIEEKDAIAPPTPPAQNPPSYPHKGKEPLHGTDLPSAQPPPSPRRSSSVQERKPHNAATPPATAERRENSEPTPSSRSGDDWGSFVAHVKKSKPWLGSMLEQGSPLLVSGERLEIGFSDGAFALARLREGDAQAILRSLAHQFFGTEPAIVLRPLPPGSADTPPNLLEKKRAEDERRRNDIMKAATSHPAVSAALEVFGGTLAEVTPLERQESE